MLKTAKRFRLSVVAMSLAIMPFSTQAAGLGRLTVISALGQPLRAEIEVTASREELSSLSPRMAPASAFKNAGIEFTPALSAIRLALDKRPNGQVFVMVTSDRPFNEPFVDMLVEMNWASGRLVREYTFLLDPPDVFKKPESAAPMAVPEVKQAPSAVPAQEAAPAAQAPAAVPPVQEPRSAAGAPPPSKGAEKPADEAASRQVAKGDTLGKIASELKPAGVSLDQMLAALFLSNKEVFDGGNMNRLRAGKILRIPDKDAAAAVEPAEARKMIVAQAADFDAYRKRLAAVAASAPAKETPPQQTVTGKIAPKVEDKAPPPAAGTDKLEVSRGETDKGAKAGARIGAMEEDLAARDKELKEANARIAALEKNLADLKTLAEMKSAASAKSAEPPVAPAKPAQPAKPALTVPAQPVEPPKPADAPKPAEPSPAAKKPAPPPPPPPSFVEENPAIVFGGGAIVALLLGYLGYGAWRKKRQAADRDGDSDSQLGSSSVFGTAGGQSVDTGEALPTDFSQQPSSTAGDEGVDPVAEADVYIAYGRDTQAEEILIEALKNDPTRTAIHLKLLEIYAARKSLPAFEAIARTLQGLTGGSGPDWERAVLLGRSIDPANPLYGGAAALGATVITTAAGLRQAEPVAPALEPAPEAAAEDVPATLDFDLDLGAAPTGDENPAASATEEAPAEDAMSLDFDLGSVVEPEGQAEAPAAPAAEPEADTPAALDFDLDTPVAAPEAAPAAAVAEAEPMLPSQEEPDAAVPLDLDFDFDLSEQAAPAVEAAPTPAAELDMPSIDLDVSAPETPAVEAPAAAEPRMPALDFEGINLDLEAPPATEPSSAPPPQSSGPAAPEEALPEISLPEASPVMADDPEVATKLELAQAYEEMGDKEGARELLNEVLGEGSPAQQDAARKKLAELG